MAQLSTNAVGASAGAFRLAKWARKAIMADRSATMLTRGVSAIT